MASSKRAKLVALLSSRQQLENLREAVEGIDAVDFDLQIGTAEQARPLLANGHSPDVLLVDLGANRDAALIELAAVMREHAGKCEVLASAQNASVDAVRQLMRLGIVDFIPSPFTRADVLAGVNAALLKRSRDVAPAEKRGKVLTFAHSCGGVGATMLAVQTAAELHLRDKRKPASVCIVDLDLQFGNVASVLDVKPSIGLLQILEAPSRLDRQFLTSVTIRHASGLNILAAPGKVVPTEAISVQTAADIVTYACGAFDYVIVDLPHAWTNWSLGVVKVSDVLVLVTEITVAGLQRSLQVRELLASQELQGVPLHLVVNRFGRGWRGGTRQVRQAEKVWGRKLDCLVRVDAKVANEARERGVLVQEVSRRSRIERDVRRLVDRLLADFERQGAALASAGSHSQQLTLEGRHVLETV
jgi:pilus assembly protein CpaE